MTIDIKELISQQENAKLDFKREWYAEDKLKTELIKDIVALANGNIHTIGQPSFLIIGIKEDTNGNELHNVELDKSLDEIKKQLLQNLPNFTTPPIQDLQMQFFEIESKKILVIQIPFHPYPIVLKKQFWQYKKDDFLYRAGEGTVVADYSTRRAFEDKMEKYKEAHPFSLSLIKITNKTIETNSNHLTPLPPINANFIGREKDLEEIKKNLESDNVVCVVNGIGGVGKSELSYKYLHEHKNEYKKIAFIEINQEGSSLEDIFKRKFSDALHLSEKDNFDTIIKRLQALPKKNLLLLDNILSDEDFKKILPLNVNFDILVTTRAKLDSNNILNLETLNKQDAKELFLSIYNTDENIEDILKYLDNHPLFINLTAYSLKEEYIDLAELKASIKSGKITDIDSKDEKTFQEHLQNTFDKQFQDEKNEDLKTLLRTLAIFPATEINFELLNKILDDKKLKVKLQKLVKRGWLSKKENSYKLHQIIKTFILEEHPIEYKDITYILENIGTYINPNDSTLIASKLNDYIPIIESILKLFEDKEDEHIAKILDSNTYLYYSLGEYNNALKMQKKSFIIWGNLYGDNSIEIAKNYHLLGVIYRSKGEYNKAEAFYQKALKIRKVGLEENHSDIATSYGNLAILYQFKGEFDKAEPLYQKALKVRKEILGDNHPDTANSYNNLAGLYKSKGKYIKAEPLYQKALKINEDKLGEIHPDTATSYNNLATLYDSKGEFNKAEPLYQKALKIRKVVLGENHPDTATNYNNLAALYYSKGDYNKVESLYLKALKIRKVVLGETYPDTATSYWNLGLFYKDRKLCSKAKELLEKCINIVEKLDYFEISLTRIKRALKEVNDSLKKEKKLHYKKKGRYCKDKI